MKGSDIVELIHEWADKRGVHPDDFESLFVPELLEMMRGDSE